MLPAFEHLHTEKAILAALLQNPNLIIDLDGKLELAAFSSPINRQLVKQLLTLYNSGYAKFDYELIYSRLVTEPVGSLTLDQVGHYIMALFKAEVNSENFAVYVADLVDVYKKNKLNELLHENISTLHTNTDKVTVTNLLSDLQGELYRLEDKLAVRKGPVDISDQLRARIMDRVINPNSYEGISTGLPILDDLIIGYLKTKFYFVAARPKDGKSSLLTQSAIHSAYLAKQRVPVLYLDTEIGTEEFEIRVISHIAAVNHFKLMRGDWYHDARSARNIEAAIQLVENNPGFLFHEHIPGFRTSNVVNIIKRFVYNHGVGLVIFDYIKEPKDSVDRDRWQKVGNFAYTLKDLAGELDIAVLSALQQNRKGEGQSRTSGESFGESDDVLKACDVALMLNKKTAKEIQTEGLDAGTHRLQIDRGRYTRSFYGGINLRFYGYCYRFETAPTQTTLEVDAQPDDVADSTAGSQNAVPTLCREEVCAYV